jgi:hypothetical protein
MASVLEKYSWSVFGPHQEMTLQGDTILGQVNVRDSHGPVKPQWIIGKQDDPTTWTDYQHLNILLYPDQSIQWRFDLPPNLNDAKFQMGLSLVDSATCHEQRLSIRFVWFLNPQSKITKIEDLCSYVHELSVNENILDFSGKRVDVYITNENNMNNGKAIRLHYPRIILDRNIPPQEISKIPSDIQPLNTDLSPTFSPPKSSANYLEAMTNAQLVLNDLIPQNGDGSMLKNGQSPWARYTLETPICQASGTKLFFRLGISGQVSKRMIRIHFLYRGDDTVLKVSLLDFPVLSDEKLHAYKLNMDLLDIPDSDCITSFDFQLVDATINPTDLWIQIKDVGFLP